MATKTNYTKNGKNYYRITKVIGHKPDGTPIKKEFYGTGYKEAKEKADKYISKLSNGLTANFDKQIFSNVLREWLFTIKRVAVKPSTFVSYEGTFRNYLSISPLSNMRMDTIKKLDVQNYYNKLFEDGKTTEKIKAINKLLHSFFEYACDEGYVLKNPCDKISIPKALNFHEAKNREFFTEEEINYIAKKINGLKFEYVVLTAIYTRNAWRRTTGA